MKKTILATLAATLIAGTAHAGGFSREGVNTQAALFNYSRFVFQFGLGIGLPRRNSENATGTNQFGQPVVGDTSTATADDFFQLDTELKARIGENFDCMLRGSMPYKASSSVDENFVGRFEESRFEIDSRAADLTCSYRYAINDTMLLRPIVGLRAISFEALRSNNLAAPIAFDPQTGPVEAVNTFDFDNDGLDYGYRAGASFEIPSILLRVQAIYESEIDVDLEGTQRYTNAQTGAPAFASRPAQFGILASSAPVSTALTLPQSFELRAQSGVNERTLVFAGIKWTDWSTIQELTVTGSPLLISGGQTTLNAGYRDGYTVTGGVGYKLTDDVNLQGSLTWDRGIGGAFSDTYTLGVGAQFDVTDEVKISVGSSVSLIEGADNAADGGGGSAFTSSLSNSGDDLAYGIGFRFQYALD